MTKTRKRFLSILLIIFIVLLQIPIVAFAETNYVAQIGTAKYETLTEAIAAVTDTTPTTIKIINDVINENTFVIGKEGSGNVSILKQNITIDLNGHEIIKDNSTGNGSIFTIIGDATLTIDDTSDQKNGLITSGNSGRMRGFDVARGTFILKGGIITTSLEYTTWSGGGVNVWKQGEFVMEGGTIRDCKAGKHGGGVNVGTDNTNGSTITKGIFTMKGGTIKNCSTPSASGWGGGVSNWTTFIMEGGTIEDNTTSNGGGGVTTSADASFIMLGGVIKNNIAKGGNLDSSGGGVCGAGTLKIGGNAVITGNKWNLVTNNFYLRNGNFIELNNPSSDMNVGIVMQNGTGKFTTNGIATNIGGFAPDNDDYAVYFNSIGYLELANGYNIVVTVNDESMGTASANFNKAAVGSQISLTATPETGYQFVRWESEDVYDVSTGQFEMPNKAVSVKAIFEPATYTITFDANEGTVTPENKNVTFGSTYGDLPVPTRTGYTFGGWYTAKETGAEIKSDTNVTITEAQTLYAKWIKNVVTHTVTFKDGENILFTRSNITSGEKVTKPEVNPSKEGYAFKGWYADATLTTEFDFDTPITNDIALYANWLAEVPPTPANPLAVDTSETNKTSNPKTRDNIYVYISLMAFAMVGIVVTTKSLKKSK